MKRYEFWNNFAVALGLTLLLTSRAYALGPTVIVGDMTDMWKWPRELAQWTTLINQATEQVNKADAMMRLMERPDQLAREVLGNVSDVTKPADDAIGLENRTNTLNFGKAVYGLYRAVDRTIDDANRFDTNFKAFGQDYQRDPKRYERYAMQEALYQRYITATKNKEAVDDKEMGLQRQYLRKLGAQPAPSPTEISLLNGLIAASKQRQDIAHQRAEQAKGEFDAFRGQLAVEDARKQEADREWAQTVITQMRTRALGAYNATNQPQMGDAQPPASSDL
jgi:hypothetical protein